MINQRENGTDPAKTDPETVGPQPPADGHQPQSSNGLSLSAALESVLFVAEQPVSATYLARVLETDEEAIAAGLQELDTFYKTHDRGLRLQKRAETYVLVSAPAAAPLIQTFLNLDMSFRLSGPALEALAVVAYRQPVTRAQVEAVRGVDCGGVLRTLQQVGLVEEVGRLESVGRPILYGVTEDFMHHFGLTDMDELPSLEETDVDALWAATELAETGQDEAQPDASESVTAESMPVESMPAESMPAELTENESTHSDIEENM